MSVERRRSSIRCEIIEEYNDGNIVLRASNRENARQREKLNRWAERAMWSEDEGAEAVEEEDELE